MKKQVAVWVLLVGLCSACFNVREPEPAKIGAASEWNPPTQPAILIENFRNAVQKLNISLYDRCFTQNFHFKADAGTAGSNPSLFANWSVAEERDYFNSLKNKSKTSGLTLLELTKTKENFFQNDSLEQIFTYKLQTALTDTAQPRQYPGTMRLILVRKQNDWQITYWEDSRQNQPCWSDLKKYCLAR